MRIPVLAVALLLAPLASQPIAVSQEASKNDAPDAAKSVNAEQHFYRLNFVVQELDENGKPLNGRSFTMTIATNSSSQIRIGSRIPVLITPPGGNPESSAQWQFTEARINFDVHAAHEVRKELAFDMSAELDAIPPVNEPKLQNRVTRHNQWHSIVLIPIGKATPVFTSDTLDSKGSMQIVVTATPLQ